MAPHLLVGQQVTLELALKLFVLFFSFLQLAYETVYCGVVKHLGLLGIPPKFCYCGLQPTDLVRKVVLA